MNKQELINLIENDKDVQRAISNALDNINYKEQSNRILGMY